METSGTRLIAWGRRVLPGPLRRVLKPWLIALCPICGYEGVGFEPYRFDVAVLRRLRVIGGGSLRRNRCPECRATARARLVWLYLELRPGLHVQRRVLHLAAEMSIARLLRSSGPRGPRPYVIADIGRHPFGALRLDLQALPFGDAAFDTVICSHVLEHVADDRRAIAEIFRVVAPGGCAILQVPYTRRLLHTREEPGVSTAEKRLERYGQDNHLRLYSAWDYVRRLRTAGFHVERYHPALDYGLLARRRYALVPRERLFVGHKPQA